jgi:flavin reductase (DIM6/NTAB) family NADH-FMN oxidoreductase RutF
MKTDDASKQLAAALGRIPSGIFVLTVAREGIETGMLASWVQQASFRPPLISFLVQSGRPILDLLPRGSRLTLNILESSQTDMVAHFGKGFASGDDAFRDVEVRREPGVAPVLAEALAYLECCVTQRHAAGDHELFLAEVVTGAVLAEGQPMVHVRKNGMHY